jgi:hypothetical protein
MRSNIAWQDILTLKAENITRIYELNVNGLTIDNRGGQFDSVCSLAQETQTNIFCCQEHNIDTTNTRVKTKMHKTMRKHWQRSQITCGSSLMPFQSFLNPAAR